MENDTGRVSRLSLGDEIHEMLNMYSRLKKQKQKGTTPINSNTKYCREIKLISINTDYCLFKFDA